VYRFLVNGRVGSLLGLLALAACGSKSAPAVEGGVGGDAAGGTGGDAAGDAAAGSGGGSAAGQAGGGAGGASTMTPTEACLAALEALCSRASVCFGETTAQCADRAVYCPDYYFNADSNRTVADVVACLPALRALTCTDVTLEAYPPCVASGNKPIGALCSFPSECQSNSCSLRTPGCTTCGTGAATVGQSCATVACRRDATCDPQTKLCVDARTTIYAAEGQPCDLQLTPPVGCSGELICVTSKVGVQAGTCKKPPGLGEPCVASWLTDSICALGLRCGGAPPNGTCVPGDTCGATTCDAGSTCQGGDGGLACVPAVVVRAIGEPCDAQHGCAFLLRCNAGGTCELAPPTACP
jgi:hypothetical protein